MISSTDIYDVTEGINYDEQTPVKADSVFAKNEHTFTELCAAKGVTPTILRCANTIGTGMNGLPMRLARGIARGTLMNVKDNDAVINTVHATDVARIARLLSANGGTYNVTSGHDTRVVDLINALAYRIKNKDVFTVGEKWARIIYGKTYYNQMTTTLTFNNMRMVHALPGDMELTDVTVYLKNHDYSNDDI
jgi:nucleoside-diphosphate-sugar epimerase